MTQRPSGPRDADDGGADGGDRPAVRPLEVQRVRRRHHDGVVLVDRLGICEPAFVPVELLPVVGRCDGTRTLETIRAEASAQLGEDVPLAFVRDVVRQLDERLLLHGERFEAAVGAAAASFLGAGARPAAHAGSAGCPADPEALRRRLADLVAEPGAVAGNVRGLVAPHIDLERGASGYAAAYSRLLAAPPADLYVVFGTGHAGPSAPITGLALDWSTPLGTVPTDRSFVAAVHERVGAPSPRDLLLHRDEHSLEFQMLFLQHLAERRGGRPFAVAGFLCGALPSASGDPTEEDYLRRLLAAFRDAERLSGARVCYLAGADLAHVGPFFGDADAVDGERLQRLRAAERERLGWLERGQAGRFHAAVEADGNRHRVCSAPAITLTALLAGGNAELLHVGDAPAPDGSQTVGFCAAAFAG